MPDTTLVRDVMTPKVMTLRADQAIGDAADEMAAHKYGAMPVVDDAGKLLGLLRDEDFIVSEARVHVPTYISLLGVSVPLPEPRGRGAAQGRGFHGRRGDGGASAHDHGRTTRSKTSRRRCTKRRSRTSRSSTRTACSSASSPAATSSGSSPGRRDARTAPSGPRSISARSRPTSRALRAAVQPATVLAVVKADGYGHGAVPVGRAALAAGASSLGVALVEEGVELRDAGIDALVLVLSEPVPEAAETVVQHRLTPVVYTRGGIDALAKAVADERRRASRSTSTSRSTPACTGSVAGPRTRSSSRGRCVAHPELRLAGTLHALRGRRRAREPVHRRAAAAVRRRARRAARQRHRSGCRARVQHRRRARVARRALRHGARRHRHLRHRARARAGRPRRAAARAVGQGARLVRQGLGAGGARVVRVALRDPQRGPHRDRAHRLRRRRAAPARHAVGARARPRACAARSRERSRWTS